MTSIVFGETSLFGGSAYSVRKEPTSVYSDDMDTNPAKIALILLSESVPISDGVQPACMARAEREPKAYRNCHVMGWGGKCCCTCVVYLLMQCYSYMVLSYLSVYFVCFFEFLFRLFAIEVLGF